MNTQRDTGKRPQAPAGEEAEHIAANAPDVEKAFLSELSLGGLQALAEAESKGISAASFYVPKHRIIWRAIVEQLNEKSAVDAVTMAKTLEDRKQLEAVGSHAGLMDVLTYSSTLALYPIHIDALREVERRRELQLALDAARAKAYDKSTPLADALEAAQSVGDRAADRRKPAAPQSAKHALAEAITQIEKMIAAKTHILGLRTGYSVLDELTGGLKGGTVTILGARPSMGKTALALNILANMLLHPVQGVEPPPVLFISAEMTPAALMERALALEACADIRQIVKQAADKAAFARIMAAFKRLKDAPLKLAEAAGARIDALLRMIRREHAAGGARLVMLDYLQLIDGSTAKADASTVDSISEVSRKLHMLAVELDIPILALAQVNRDASGRPPVLADLKGSGSIEQDADTVIFLDRPEKYLKEDAPEEKRAELAGVAWLDIAKNRSGETGRVKMRFIPQWTRFEPWQD